MKRMVRDAADPEVVDIKIDVYHNCRPIDVIATDIRPVVNEMKEIDSQAYADYYSSCKQLCEADSKENMVHGMMYKIV